MPRWRPISTCIHTYNNSYKINRWFAEAESLGRMQPSRVWFPAGVRIFNFLLEQELKSPIPAPKLIWVKSQTAVHLLWRQMCCKRFVRRIRRLNLAVPLVHFDKIGLLTYLFSFSPFLTSYPIPALVKCIDRKCLIYREVSFEIIPCKPACCPWSHGPEIACIRRNSQRFRFRKTLTALSSRWSVSL